MHPFHELPVAALSREEQMTSGGTTVTDAVLSAAERLLQALGFEVRRAEQPTGCLG